MTALMWICAGIFYFIIGFVVAYLFYSKTEIDFRATTNILFWPLISVAAAIFYGIWYLGKLSDLISKKVEQSFKKIDKRDYISKRRG